MRRTWWFRPLATILTLWLPLIIGEPSMLQPCPTHGSVFVASTAAPVTHAAHQAGASSGHASHHAAQAPESSHHSAPGHHHNCSCIGCCAGSPAIVPTLEGPTTTFVVAAYEVAPQSVAAESLPRLAPAFSRPYTTGPPRA